MSVIKEPRSAAPLAELVVLYGPAPMKRIVGVEVTVNGKVVGQLPCTTVGSDQGCNDIRGWTFGMLGPYVSERAADA